MTVLSFSDVVTHFHELVKSVGQRVDPEPYVIMIDGLNYLETDHNAHTGAWLPDELPKVITIQHICHITASPIASNSLRNEW